uniref:Scaffolding anchor of CK1 domain-containing protein n=1 Tax=Mola mola TaxID=94237 RepID=A0A3Q3X2X5_MOLML
MALSQLQCLDDHHVNPRTSESKAEFLYCEEQRLALEVLLKDGREAFFKFLEDHGLRGFLSDPELEALSGTVQPFDPGSELLPESAEDGDPLLSLQYWPELSDMSVPQMDLGWPDSEAYRGVTRTSIYSQPPLDGQAHIKEVIRKMIVQAQKVIAVVMDVFTDVDIFRDLLDIGFKKRVSVYILLESTTLPHFLSMCQRANMHAGHLKHLRVRCSDGIEFYTRSSSVVKGRMGHRFMFIDGNKAVSGSYSFSWMSSRLDRNLITVITGQAVEAFDTLFHILYMNSSLVDLQQVAMEPEPEPHYIPQPTIVHTPSAIDVRKMYNPKYALVLGNSSPTPSNGHTDPNEIRSQENSRNPEVQGPKKQRQNRASKESMEAPPIHPGLTNLEKACLISYLPTWPEPDPPSDVIGFINIRDTSKPVQAHLQRSEMFENSQAIRFSSPVTIPKENLPEVAKPRQFTAEQDEVKTPTQEKAKTEESVGDRLLHTLPKPSRGLQQDTGASPSPQSRPSRPLLGARPSGSHQAESKALPGSFHVPDSTSSHKRPPSRPLPPSTGGAGKTQAQVSHSQQSLLSRQPPALQGGTKAMASNLHLHPKPLAPFFRAHPDAVPQRLPQSQNWTGSAEEKQDKEDRNSSFNINIGKLYNLKNYMNKLPAESKKGSSPAVQTRKSTS